MSISTWVWHMTHRRCEAIATNSAGESVMDNPLSVYRAPLLPGERCQRPVAAALKGTWGYGVVNICTAHAEMLARDTSFRIDVNRELLPRAAVTATGRTAGGSE